MRVNVIMSSKEKKIAGVAILIILLVIFYFNKKYIYVLDVEMEEDGSGNLMPVKTLIKSGFIFPVKTELNIMGEEEKKVKWYGYTLKAIKGTEGDNYYDLLLNGSKIHSFYSDSYYQATKTHPTGLINN